jgi:hypothetical protein
MKKAQRDESSPSYQETTRDTGEPLPAFLEPYIFPKYLTDETRELSYLEDPEMLSRLAENVLASYDVLRDWQQAFEFALTDVEEFPEVRRRVFRLLPEDVQQAVLW